MGWEYHERRRKNGKFIPDWSYDLKNKPVDQLHIRMPAEEARAAREAAAGNMMELGAYVRQAVKEKVERDNRKRAKWAQAPGKKRA